MLGHRDKKGLLEKSKRPTKLVGHGIVTFVFAGVASQHTTPSYVPLQPLPVPFIYIQTKKELFIYFKYLFKCNL